jgi:hypothetical protein
LALAIGTVQQEALMTDELLKVTLAALLHDVGKFAQREEQGQELYFPLKGLALEDKKGLFPEEGKGEIGEAAYDTLWQRRKGAVMCQQTYYVLSHGQASYRRKTFWVVTER